MSPATSPALIPAARSRSRQLALDRRDVEVLQFRFAGQIVDGRASAYWLVKCRVESQFSVPRSFDLSERAPRGPSGVSFEISGK